MSSPQLINLNPSSWIKIRWFGHQYAEPACQHSCYICIPMFATSISFIQQYGSDYSIHMNDGIHSFSRKDMPNIEIQAIENFIKQVPSIAS